MYSETSKGDDSSEGVCFIQEVTELQELNSQLKSDLERRQLAELRQMHKKLKTETRTRTVQFKKSQRITPSASLSPEQELERLKEVCNSPKIGIKIDNHVHM